MAERHPALALDAESWATIRAHQRAHTLHQAMGACGAFVLGVLAWASTIAVLCAIGATTGGM